MISCFVFWFLIFFLRGKYQCVRHPQWFGSWHLALLAPQDKERLVPALPDIRLSGKEKCNVIWYFQFIRAIHHVIREVVKEKSKWGCVLRTKINIIWYTKYLIASHYVSPVGLTWVLLKKTCFFQLFSVLKERGKNYIRTVGFNLISAKRNLLIIRTTSLAFLWNTTIKFP